VNPPEGEQPPEELKGRAQNLAEVESILDEIENLVSNKSQEPEETAKRTPVLENSKSEGLEEDVVSTDSDLDLGRLEEELHSAIASELEKKSDEDVSVKNEESCEQSIPEDEITKLAEVFEEAEEAAKARPERSLRTRDLAVTEMIDEEEGASIQEISVGPREAGLLKMLSRPMEGLSPTMRVVVNIIAITLALWVPLIWLIALNGGFARQDAVATDFVEPPLPSFVENSLNTP
jgi:hypothetical protein